MHRYLQAKAMKETERCFMEDIEYATNESDDDSVEDKTCSTNPTEIESESDDDSVEDKTCLTNPTEKESESDDDSVEDKTCLTNPTEKESESDDDSVEDKTCSTNPTEKESESDDDSVEDKTCLTNPTEKESESDDDSVEDKTCSTNPTEKESESDDDSVEDKTCLTNPTEKESESDDDSVEDKTCSTNPTEKESESDDDSVEDKTCLTNPTEKESESDDDSVEDKTCLTNPTEKESESDDDSVTNKQFLPYPTEVENKSNDDSVEDKTCLPNLTEQEIESDDDSVTDKTFLPNHTEVKNKSNDDSVADKTFLPNPTEKESESDDDSVEYKTCLPNPTEEENKSNDDSVEDKTCLPNPTEEESESDDSVTDKTFLPYPTEVENKSNDDSVEYKTCLPYPTEKESVSDDDSVADKTVLPNPEEEESESDADSVADKTFLPNPEEEESESDDDSVADKTFLPNPEEEESESDDDSVADKTFIPNPEEEESESDDDSVADKTFLPNPEEEESESDDDSVADKTFLPNPEEEESESDYDSVADKSCFPKTDEHASDSAETDGEMSDIFPMLSEKSSCFSSSIPQHQEDSESESERLDEDSILRDVNHPNIYIKRVLKNDMSKTGTIKKHERVYNSYQYCGACKLMTSNLAQHISRHIKSSNHPHASDREIQAIRSEQNEIEKKRLLKLLRARYNHESNMKTKEKGKGVIILERRPTTDFNVNKYGPCPQCLLWVAKKLLKKHQKKCINRKTNAYLSIGDLTTQSECLAKDLLPIASKRLVKEVFSKMTSDEVGKTVKGDQLIVQLGNQWLEKNVGNVLKRGIYTSQIMRLVGRFLLNLRKICPQSNIQEPSLWQYLKPEYFNDIVNATVLTASPISDEDDSLQAPSNAIKLGYDLKRLLNGKIGLAIMDHDEQSQSDAGKVLKLMDIYWGSRVTKAARVLLDERRYYAEKHLPHPEDILKLNCYLQDSISQLDYKKTDKMNFRLVAELIEAKLILYNRRRTGELQAVRLQDYVRRTKGCSGEYLVGECTAFEKQLLESQEVMTIRGKTGRGVPVILPSETAKGLAYLTDSRVRISAGVHASNHYIFASQGDSIVWAYDALRKAAEAALLKNPAAITSTNLRKYMATVTQVLDLKENQMQWVLNHLGHTMDVHKIHYRATSDIIERTQIAKILLLQDQGRVGEFRNQCLDDIELEDIVFTRRETNHEPTQDLPGLDVEGLSCPEIITETLHEAAEFFPDLEETSGLGKPKRKPAKSTKKCSWTDAEEKEIKELFKTFFNKSQRPKPSDCLKAISISQKRGGLICKRKKDVLKKKVFRMIDKLK
ncbi:uncharacterized protein LOC132740548 isoform X2 [Ruditapes philippinarum]|uniref:uncharacterized protein LOC132740548 isoform X2 n=1 Tax=Ruditapes philippinarum TaxID=129788 RepID=UPI00295A62C7|nr:uncharacterized protein LOC132740548 isoform X2 [Ruditapes philippinarum]